MKLRFDAQAQCWLIGDEAINCGRQVQIEFTDVNGDRFFVWGRFEIYGDNNPVFYTACGRYTPDLAATSVRTRNMIIGGAR